VNDERLKAFTAESTEKNAEITEKSTVIFSVISSNSL